MPKNELNTAPGSSNATEFTTTEDKAKLSHADAQAFEDARKSLYELAFSILRSELEAHRAVRHTLVNWLYADRQTVDNPAAWLSQNCLHQSLKIFRWTQRGTDGDLGERLGVALNRIRDDAEPDSHAPPRSWLSRFVRSQIVQLAKGFAICGAIMHPVVIFQADQFQAEEDQAARRSEFGERQD
jgi:DNA-directed RNA polymerase specialized sigma24 family protein